jgi:hypothetical protein
VPRHLQDDPIALALRLCELPEPVIGGQSLEDLPVAASWLKTEGALCEGRLLKGFLVDDDFEGPPCEVAWRPETGSYAYISRTGRWIEVPAEHLRLWVLDLGWLLRQICEAIGIGPRPGPVELVGGILWDLGEAWLGRRKGTILFGRCLGEVANLDALQDALIKRVGRPPGVLLTTSRHLSRHLALPGGHRVVCIHDCREQHPRRLDVNIAILAAAVRDARSAGAGPLVASGDFGTIRVGDRLFVFRGSRQRQVVQHLHEHWQRGQPRVSVAMMWTELELASGTRLRDLFKGHPDWQDLIAYEQGLCWLRV